MFGVNDSSDSENSEEQRTRPELKLSHTVLGCWQTHSALLSPGWGTLHLPEGSRRQAKL